MFMNTENSKLSEPHKFFLNLSQILDLMSSNKIFSLQKLYIYYTKKYTRQQHKNNKLKIIAPTFLALNYQMFVFSVIYSKSYQVHHKKHESTSINSAIPIYFKVIINRVVFKIADRYKLELQTPETRKLFGSTKKLIEKTKNGGNYPVLKWLK